MVFRKFNKWFGFARLTAILVLLPLLMLRIADPLVVQTVRNQSFDFYQQLKPREYSKLPIAILDINEESLEKYGQWPWPRTRMAEVLQKLREAGVVATALDIIFSEEDRLSPGLVAEDNPQLSSEIVEALKALPSNDDVFASEIARGRIVLGQTSARKADDTRSSKTPIIEVQHAILGPDPKKNMLQFNTLVRNLPVLEAASPGKGVFSVIPDTDGIYRRVPLMMLFEDKIKLSLSAELLRVGTGGGAVAIKSNEAGITGLVLAGKEIQTDANGWVWPYFAKTSPSRYVSAASLLDGTMPAGRLANHLVFVGTSAVGLEDLRAFPLEGSIPGVEIHAQVIENFLTDSLLVRPNYAFVVELAAALALCLGAIIFIPLLGAVWSFVSAAFLVAGYLGTSYWAFDQYRFLIDPSFPAIATTLIFIWMLSANYLKEERNKQQIRSSFGQYVSPDLVSQLADDPEKLKLGGETRELSILFSDVRGFTGISESFKDNPAGLTELMNKFLTVLSNAVLRYNGTIDKFMGDAIMAFWNAPLDNKNHAKDACLAALDMMKDVKDLNESALKEHEEQVKAGVEGLVYHAINVGIGVNSGSCVVGNMGSENRFDYTALGDAVNLASRLEGQSKPYGVEIVIGNNTAVQVRDELATMEIDQIRVKGKTEPETVHGLFGDNEFLNSDDFKALRAMNRSMLASYRGQDWASAYEALSLMKELEDKIELGLDEYLFIYESRIAEFRHNPPGKNWDGVYEATSK